MSSCPEFGKACKWQTPSPFKLGDTLTFLDRYLIYDISVPTGMSRCDIPRAPILPPSQEERIANLRSKLQLWSSKREVDRRPLYLVQPLPDSESHPVYTGRDAIILQTFLQAAAGLPIAISTGMIDITAQYSADYNGKDECDCDPCDRGWQQSRCYGECLNEFREDMDNYSLGELQDIEGELTEVTQLSHFEIKPDGSTILGELVSPFASKGTWRFDAGRCITAMSCVPANDKETSEGLIDVSRLGLVKENVELISL